MNLNTQGRTGRAANVAGYVMAGGASRRFGSDKALVAFDGQTLLSRMCALVRNATGNVRVVAPRGRYVEHGITIVEDRWPDEGPLGGIITALSTTASGPSGQAWNLIVSCDMPFLTFEWLEFLCACAAVSRADVVVPRSEHGLEPLCACWRTTAAASLQSTFDQGARKVTDAMKRLGMEVLDEKHWKRFDSAGQLFWNMNTPRDYETALRTWYAGKK